MPQRKGLIRLLLALIVGGSVSGLLILRLTTAFGATTTYYVSTDAGLDTNAGTLNQPFKTISKAASLAKAGDTVLVRAGIYRESITPTSSGSSGAPITFAPYNNEVVTISGADLINNGSWTAVGNGLYSTAWLGRYLSANNQSDQVFVDGAMINLARWPQETNRNLSRPRVATIDSILSAVDTGNKAPGPGYPIYRVTFYDAEFNESDGRWTGAKIWVNSGNPHTNGDSSERDGNGQSGTVVSTSQANHTITMDIDAGAKLDAGTPGNFQLGVDNQYYLFDPPNVTGLLYNGEFWHDNLNGQLYLRTPDGSSPTTHLIEFKKRDWAFNLDGKSYITAKGFRLFATSVTTDKNAGNGQGNGGSSRYGSVAPANHITLDGLNVTYVSHFADQTGNLQTQWSESSGIILSGSDNVIQNSTISWSAGTALVVIGNRNKAYNNIINDTNYNATDGGAVSLGRSTDISSLDEEISFNTIFNTGIDGIEISGLKNSSSNPATPLARIHNNLIHDTVLQSADSGAIHAFGSDGHWVRIDHNVIYNTGPTDSAYIYMGIYLDYPPNDGNSPGRYIIDHNVVYATPQCISVNHANTDYIYNNTTVSWTTVARSGLSSNGGGMPGVELKNNLSNTVFRGVGSQALVQKNIENANTSIFVDATNPDRSQRDYRLKASDPNIVDAGVNVAPYNDATPPDIGAYEFGQPKWLAGASPIINPPPAPTATPIPATATPIPATATPIPATPLPTTATAGSATPVPATAMPTTATPTLTGATPTVTAISATATPVTTGSTPTPIPQTTQPGGGSFPTPTPIPQTIQPGGGSSPTPTPVPVNPLNPTATPTSASSGTPAATPTPVSNGGSTTPTPGSGRPTSSATDTSCQLPEWAKPLAVSPLKINAPLVNTNPFYKTWARYDFFAPGKRTYVWGAKPFSQANEPYYQAKADSLSATRYQQRLVFYWDKSRMEITDLKVNPASLGYITNGLLVVELITGRVQLGDNLAEPLQLAKCRPAQVPVAGDSDDTNGPTYASLANRLSDPALGVGSPVTAAIDHTGQLSKVEPGLLDRYKVTGGYYEPITRHMIASPFWNFLNSKQSGVWQNGQNLTSKLFDPYWYAPGLPITEAYWAKVKVGGQVKDVLIQAFERRVLTYTPSNPTAYQVEWGNVGLHYYQWRYGTQS